MTMFLEPLLIVESFCRQAFLLADKKPNGTNHNSASIVPSLASKVEKEKWLNGGLFVSFIEQFGWKILSGLHDLKTPRWTAQPNRKRPTQLKGTAPNDTRRMRHVWTPV